MVSIHVPARGTTSLVLADDAYSVVSIHVPARGTTVYQARGNIPQFVSIHVPARGTTQILLDNRGVTKFQSTFPHGERRNPAIYI